MRQFDRTLRVVMWLDAFLSAALAVLGAVASPIVAVVGLPHGVVFALGLTAIGAALLLASFGAITAPASTGCPRDCGCRCRPPCARRRPAERVEMMEP